MRKIALRVLVAILTFIIGVSTVAVYYVVPVVRQKTQQAREMALEETLRQTRKAIDQYAADRGELPRSLDNLVEAKLLPNILIDPVTEKRDWQIVTGTELNSKQLAPGIIDIHSRSSEMSSKNTRYNQW